MPLQVVATASPVEIAWAVYDAAATRLAESYQLNDPSATARLERMAMAEEVLRLWEIWRAALLADDETPPEAA